MIQARPIVIARLDASWEQEGRGGTHGVRRSCWDALPPLDRRLLHVHGSVCAVKLVVET